MDLGKRRRAPRSPLLAVLVTATLLAIPPPGVWAAASIPSGNLIANPSFESSTQGWGGLGLVSRVSASDAPHGGSVAMVQPRNGSSAIADNGTNLGPFNAAEGDLGPSKAGWTYTASAYVKGANATAGRTARLVVRETRPDGTYTHIGAAESSVTLSSSTYTRVQTAYRAQGTGNTIDVYLYRPSETLVSGDAFYVDAVTLLSSQPSILGRPTVGAIALQFQETDGLLTETGSRLRYMVIPDSRRADVPRLRQQNPATKILVYKNAAAVVRDGCQYAPYEASGVSECTMRSHEEWYLHDRAAPSERLNFGGDLSYLEAANTSDRGYQERWITETLATLAAGQYDGVFIDDVNTEPQHGMNGRVLELTDDEYRQGTLAFMGNVGPELQRSGYIAMPNVGLGNPGDSATRTAARQIGLRSSVYGREHFVRYGSGSLFSGSQYSNELTLMESMGAIGIPYFAIVYGTRAETAVQAYARATFLLGWAGGDLSALVYEDSGAAESTYMPEWTVDVGTPTGARYTVGVGLRRNFKGGTVILNPSASTSQTFKFERNYQLAASSSGSPVCSSGVYLAPTSSMILRPC